MRFATISSKGQITLPSNIRNQLDIKPKDKVEIIIKDGEIIIKSVASFRGLRGSIPGKKGSARKAMEKAVAKHVAGEDK
ncbi:MAG TPA: AbrB/MazE/SpoVT family DNA-binding domain-containing protein [Nitrospirae bacterium]|nr:AbrB/MazE/SpoVT family DNA-binding domain-containing protein [Nitrospirota bacterium]